MPSLSTGRVILLNGTSSSGKTSIATALVEILPGPWFNLGIDVLHRARTPGHRSGEVFERTARGYHRVLAAMATTGNDVIADQVIGGPWRLDDCLEALAGVRVLFVGVRCPLPVVEVRERERSNRPPGQAARQIGTVHAHARYDLEVDTSVLTPQECATQIRQRLESGPATAFDDLRERTRARQR
ncbi:chloramphenicol phosphotransferase CPT family protein [Kribbella catacumbae]|uniref:chloramphenicol phosphotransferase CPT family protein n=1 Tax=Kribbella catacumbae TaxID=460086 RepID=UPI0003623DB9|nr:AAA family ATPase [Kribbella catacumbae]